jgi:hypothetical protein
VLHSLFCRSAVASGEITWDFTGIPTRELTWEFTWGLTREFNWDLGPQLGVHLGVHLEITGANVGRTNIAPNIAPNAERTNIAPKGGQQRILSQSRHGSQFKILSQLRTSILASRESRLNLRPYLEQCRSFVPFVVSTDRLINRT